MADRQSSAFWWSDAWLLLAVNAAEREGAASLQAVIASADAIQHAIISPEELSGGVARLRAAGFLDVSPGRLSVTPAGRALLGRADRRTYSAALAALETLLEAAPWSGEYRPEHAASDQASGISTIEYDAAVDAYTSRLGSGVKRT
jgi:hypothetical protein